MGPSFNSLMVSNLIKAGEKSYDIGITYSFSRFGLPAAQHLPPMPMAASSRSVGRRVQRDRRLPHNHRRIEELLGSYPLCP